MGGSETVSEEHSETVGMTLRTAQFSADAIVSNAQVVDGLTCDCCQTDVGQTDRGPVAVYRNRTPDEIRDIYISRFVNGSWQQGQAVHNDGWNIAGCPVNGPVVRANGSTVVVTWFTSAGNKPVINSAWSHDAGLTFAPPIIVADEAVIGYVGSAMMTDDSITASWLCKASPQNNTICFRAVDSDGALGTIQQLETQGVVPRMSVPQLAMVDGRLLFVWTDKVNDQNQINSKFVSLDSISDRLNVARNR